MTTHLLTTLIAALTLAACQPAPSTADAATADTPAAPHNLIIYYHGDNIDALRRAVSTYGAEILYHYPNLHGIAVRIPAQKKPGRCRNLFQPPTGNKRRRPRPDTTIAITAAHGRQTKKTAP